MAMSGSYCIVHAHRRREQRPNGGAGPQPRMTCFHRHNSVSFTKHFLTAHATRTGLWFMFTFAHRRPDTTRLFLLFLLQKARQRSRYRRTTRPRPHGEAPIPEAVRHKMNMARLVTGTQRRRRVSKRVPTRSCSPSFIMSAISKDERPVQIENADRKDVYSMTSGSAESSNGHLDASKPSR